ncbi:hypothetical protein JOQ06_000490 [Pogonophryne albipinna]|uniref:Uncharacterized protein n=1 Tax=Pogonophryne albipinna TaxID=1090488 RepID=A0AAD6AGT9_9TELE|nr:hypothetical protein JOQ06_000490 [Pogonophryne albipinna]
MSDRCVEIMRDSRQSWNDIPAGRQLLRTPPMTVVKQQLHFCTEDSSEEQVKSQLDMEADTAVEDGNDQNATFDAIVPKTEPEEPNTMLKGMKGCQLTQNDLEFMEKIKEDKLIKELQGDLKEVQRLVSKELMQLELALASREKAHADLKMSDHPSCEDLMEWVKEVLSMTSPSTQLADLDLDCFLDTLKVHGLMSQMSNLICELSQEEDAYKALKIQMNTQEEEAAGVEADKVLVKEKPQDPKVQAKTRGKGRLKAVTFQEQAKSKTKSRRKLADGKTESGKHDKEKPTKSVKESKGPQKRVQKQEASSQEALQSVGGRRKKTEEAPSTTRREAPSTTRREAPSTTRREAPSTPRREAPSTTRREAPSTTRREAPSTTRREDPSTTRREAPSTPRREAPSTTRREAPSTTRREAPSTPRREDPSTPRREAPSTTRREAPSTTRREAPSTTRREAPSTTRLEAPSTPQQEAPPQGRKEETTVLRRSKRIASKSH